MVTPDSWVENRPGVLQLSRLSPGSLSCLLRSTCSVAGVSVVLLLFYFAISAVLCCHYKTDSVTISKGAFTPVVCSAQCQEKSGGTTNNRITVSRTLGLWLFPDISSEK